MRRGFPFIVSQTRLEVVIRRYAKSPQRVFANQVVVKSDDRIAARFPLFSIIKNANNQGSKEIVKIYTEQLPHFLCEPTNFHYRRARQHYAGGSAELLRAQSFPDVL
jgi:hypothetical protein